LDNQAQIDYWNGAAGEKWVRDADRLDRMLGPFAEAVIEAVRLAPGQLVTDIGCGAGALSLGIEAGSVNVSVTGVDVSQPLVALAQRRAEAAGARAKFVVADASSWVPDMPADAVVSRFGVMFFADPVAAFRNIRSGTKAGGQLSFACWRPLAENPWALTPLMAALPLLKEPPAPPEPGAPGPFAFGEQARILGILGEAGWSEITVKAWDGDIHLPGADPAETAAFLMEIGPLARLIKEQALEDALIRSALEAQVRKLSGEEGRTRMKAAAWIVGARA
jgi:SAM-dependent methyltransferase